MCLCAPDMSNGAGHKARVKGLVVRCSKGERPWLKGCCFESLLSQGMSPLLHCTSLSMQVFSERGIPSKSKGSRLKIFLGVHKAHANGKPIGQRQTNSAY